MGARSGTVIAAEIKMPRTTSGEDGAKTVTVIATRIRMPRTTSESGGRVRNGTKTVTDVKTTTVKTKGSDEALIGTESAIDARTRMAMTARRGGSEARRR